MGKLLIVDFLKGACFNPWDWVCSRLGKKKLFLVMAFFKKWGDDAIFWGSVCLLYSVIWNSGYWNTGGRSSYTKLHTQMDSVSYGFQNLLAILAWRPQNLLAKTVQLYWKWIYILICFNKCNACGLSLTSSHSFAFSLEI